jgi:CRP-like cAMP-binding protein
MSSTITTACQNHLLAALPISDLKALLPHMELVEISKGHQLYPPGTEIRNVYFPLTTIVSLLYTMDNGATPEVAVVGNEGMVGVSTFLGGETTPSIASVESSGFALRLSATDLRKGFRQAGKMQKFLLLYVQALTSEVAQTLACMKEHTLHQIFCRWLLLRFDRLPTNILRMSQESIAALLGVRRSGISEIANVLKSDQVISYSRGCIVLLDRAALEKQSCECYRAIKDEFERLLPA